MIIASPKNLLALAALMTGVSISASAQTTLLNDQFNDGDRASTTASGGEVLLTSGWFQRNANFTNIVTVNSSNALQLNPTSSTLNGFSGASANSQINGYFSLVTLADNETITVTADLKFVGAALPNAATQFGVGLFNSNGTKDTVDTTANTNRTEDSGYVARYNPQGGATGTNLAEKTGADLFTVTQLGSTFGANWDSLANTHTVTFSIKRISATSVDVSFGISGILTTTTLNDSSASATAFDEVSFFASNNTNNGYALDNITISVIPEPSTYAAIAGLGILGLAAARRRRIAR